MSERYYVFSDETGHRCDSRTYIRSWLILKEKEYSNLKAKIDLLKKQIGKEGELKYSNGHDYSIFEDLDFDVYFTVTFCEDFNQRNFQIISHMNEQDDSLFEFRERNIKEKIVNTIKHSIFLNLYEYHHLENFTKFLDGKYPDGNFFFFIDSPQYQNRDWTEMFAELCRGSNLKIVNKSEDFDGIQFADVLAGSMGTILNKLRGAPQLNSFERFLFSKFSQQNGATERHKNNPQIVFWNEIHQELVDKIVHIMGGEDGN